MNHPSNIDRKLHTHYTKNDHQEQHQHIITEKKKTKQNKAKQ
jgi:hypothetical protein